MEPTEKSIGNPVSPMVLDPWSYNQNDKSKEVRKPYYDRNSQVKNNDRNSNNNNIDSQCGKGVHKHNSIYSDVEDKYYIEHSVNGSTLNLKKDKRDCWSSGMKRDWVRGKIEGYSFRSQRRLREKHNNLDKVRLNPKSSVLITLTYPSTHITLKNGKTIKVEDIDKKIYKKHMNNFITQLKNYMWKEHRNNYFFGFTRFEFQKRRGGIGHYHLLLYCMRKVDMDWLSRTWNRIVGGDEKHLKYGTRVERPRNWSKVGQYVCKVMSYITKDHGYTLNKSTGEIQELRPMGRHWTVIRQEKMKTFIKMKTVECKKKTYHGLKRLSFKTVENSIRKKYQELDENGYWVFKGKDEKQKKSYEESMGKRMKKWKKKRYLIDQLGGKMSFYFVRTYLERLLHLYGYKSPKELLSY